MLPARTVNLNPPEHLAKVNVEGSNPFARSISFWSLAVRLVMASSPCFSSSSFNISEMFKRNVFAMFRRFWFLSVGLKFASLFGMVFPLSVRQ